MVFAFSDQAETSQLRRIGNINALLTLRRKYALCQIGSILELVFGPIVPAQFRLSGHGAHADGEARLHDTLASLERSPAPPEAEQLGLLQMLANTETPWAGVLEALSAFESA